MSQFRKLSTDTMVFSNAEFMFRSRLSNTSRTGFSARSGSDLGMPLALFDLLNPGTAPHP